jgi:hypothetical protein
MNWIGFFPRIGLEWGGWWTTRVQEEGIIAHAHAPPEGDLTYVSWFVLVLVVWLVVVLANTLATSPPHRILGFLVSRGEGPVAQSLYLPCTINGYPAYLRRMSLRRAQLLSKEPWTRGQWVDLIVEGYGLRAKVIRVHPPMGNRDHLVSLALRTERGAKREALRQLIAGWCRSDDSNQAFF